jgi:hypothetical protein
VPASDLVLSEPEIALPLSYYFDERLLSRATDADAACDEACWWIVRQPYTATHAFTQSVEEAGFRSPPSVPPGCTVQDGWESTTGIGARSLKCGSGK